MSTLESRFGSIDYQDQDVLHFPDGLVGFSGLNRFLLLEHKPGSAFRWLQSVDDPAVAFLMADPFVYVPDYAPMIGDGALASLGLTPDTVTFTYVTAANVAPRIPDSLGCGVGALLFGIREHPMLRSIRLVV